MHVGWHPQDIMAEVRKRGSNLQRLAREHGFAKTSFNKALTATYPPGSTFKTLVALAAPAAGIAR